MASAAVLSTPSEWLALFNFFSAWVFATFGQTVSQRGSGSGKSRGQTRRQRRSEQWRSVPGAPPAWAFGVVWLILYVMLAIGTFLFWRSGPCDKCNIGFAFIFANWLLNKAWVPIFFGFDLVELALVDILLVDATAIAVVIIMAQAEQWVAFWLWIPYVLWGLYATYLNIAVVRFA